MSASILISTFPPFPTLSLTASLDTPFSELHDLLADRYPALPADLVLSPHRGCIPSPQTLLSSLYAVQNEEDAVPAFVSLRLVPRLRGGKGGFGSQLRAAGGRMSSQKTSNNDSCRDLSGRRLSTIKEAKRLAEYIESEPARKKAQNEAQKAKLQALEKKLGMVPGAGPSEPVAGKKHRFDDTEYLEQSRDIVDNVKSAVTAAMLKKRKKAKTSHSLPAADAAASVAPAVSESASTAPAASAPASASTSTAEAIAEKILDSPATIPAVAVASVAAGLAASA